MTLSSSLVTFSSLAQSGSNNSFRVQRYIQLFLLPIYKNYKPESSHSLYKGEDPILVLRDICIWHNIWGGQWCYTLDYSICIPEVTSKWIVNIIPTEVFSRYGYPRCILSNNNSQFTSRVWKNAMEDWGIENWITPV